jgi:hypothetical protein
VESAPQPGQPEPGQPEPGQPEPGQPDRARAAGPGQPGQGRAAQALAVVAACYAMLFLLGIAEGVIGAFQYSGGIGPFPGAALGFAALILVTCVLAARGMRRPVAGLMPAVGWFAASFVLAMRTAGGSIVITNTAAGKWFLFGGAVCAAAGVVASFTVWSAPRAPRRGGPPWPGDRRPGELRPRKPGS